MEAHNEFVERMNKAHFIISNFFVSVSVTDVKLVVITGTEEHGDIFIVTSCSKGIFQVSHNEGKQNMLVTSAQDFITRKLMDPYISAIELEDHFGTRITVF
jgi:hypothetical protein